MGKINDAADAEGASVAFGPYGRRTLFATATRYESVACDEGRFIFPEECASAPLGLSPPEECVAHINTSPSSARPMPRITRIKKETPPILPCMGGAEDNSEFII